jgi:hypothetical protein
LVGGRIAWRAKIFAGSGWIAEPETRWPRNKTAGLEKWHFASLRANPASRRRRRTTRRPALCSSLVCPCTTLLGVSCL